MSKVIKPPKPLVDGFSVFLAGSIEMGKAEEWQKKVEELFSDTDVIIFNPRRDDWDSSWKQEIENDKFREQVEWELDAQEKANNIIMYFSPKTASPISLLELGLFARTGKMVVCCPEGYEKKGNVDIVCKKYNVSQVDTLEQAVKIVKNKIGENTMKETKIKELIRGLIREVINEDLSDTEPASPRQLWALYAATKKDYRNAGLSKKAAYDLLQKINAEKGYAGKQPTDFKKDLLTYLQKNSGKVAQDMRKQLDIKSVIGSDPAFFGKDYADKQPKYAFFGGGMGFAWLEFDKRSNTANAIYKAYGDIEKQFNSWFLSKYFTSKEHEAYKKLGWPLQAMLAQNMSVKAEIMKLVADFMESKGVKNIRLRTRID